MGCDLCGYSGELIKAKVEGTILNVCSKCSSYGKVLSTNTVNIQKNEVVEEVVVINIGNIVRLWREDKGLTQEEVALKLNEKESLVRKIESGFMPSLDIAKKLQKLVGVKLVEFEKFEALKKSDTVSGMTIGDLLKK